MRDRFSNNKKDSYSPESKGGGIETDSSIRYFLRRPVEPVGEYSVSGRALVSGMYRMWRKVGGGGGEGSRWAMDRRPSPLAS